MTRLVLCLFTVDYKDGIPYVLSKSTVQVALPYRDNDTSISIKDNLVELVDSCIKADTDWLKLKIFDIRNIDGITEVLYFGRIPNEYKYMTKNTFFVRPEMSDDDILLKMKYYI